MKSWNNKRNASHEHRHIIDVVITKVANPAITYQWNPETLQATPKNIADAQEPGCLGDLGVHATLHSIPVLVLGLPKGLSFLIDAVVPCIVLGAITDADHRIMLLTWPQMLEDTSNVLSMRVQILDVVQYIFKMVAPFQLLSVVETIDFLRVERAEQRKKARQKEHSQSFEIADESTYQPQWRLPEGVHYERTGKDGIGIFDDVPALLEYIPYRFQRYLSLLLLDDERVLFFAERPERKIRNGFFYARRQRTMAGIFLITDHRLLWLTDSASPSATYMHWSFSIEVIPFGRMAGVTYEVSQQTRFWMICCALRSAIGSSSTLVELPDTFADLQGIIQPLIEGFLPRSEGYDTRLQCVFEVEPWHPSSKQQEELAYIDTLVAEDLAQQMHHIIEEMISHECCLITIIIPPFLEARSPLRAIAATPTTFYSVIMDNRGIRKELHLSLNNITSLSLHHSILGCHLRIVVPTNEMHHPQHIDIPFTFALFLPFRILFTMLSILLHRPYIS